MNVNLSPTDATIHLTKPEATVLTRAHEVAEKLESLTSNIDHTQCRAVASAAGS